MDVLAITKWKGSHDIPKYYWTYIRDRPDCFTKEAMNFNTFVRAFAHNPLQWRYIELKLCDYFRVEDWDSRIIDVYHKESKTEKWYKSIVQEIWRVAMEIAEEIHII